MKRTILVALAATLGFSATASAAEKPGQWYVSPMASVIWADKDRFADDDFGAALSLGRAINDDWNLELHAFGYQMDGANPTDLWGGGIDAMRLFYRNSRTTPYLLFGVGWDKKNRGFGPDSDAPYFNAGLGFLFDLTQSGSVALRAELRYRAENDNQEDEAFDTVYEDLIGSVGIQIPFGSAYAQPVVAAPPPPPPPPPPPAPPPPPPADSDGDGVVDASDLCPNTPMGDKVDVSGCSCDFTLALNFATNSAELTGEDRRLLDSVIADIRKLAHFRAVVEGHTDSRGSEAYNQGLSQRRAESVHAYLRNAGIGEGQLAYAGYGESRPIADNATAEGRAANRRVVVSRTDCK